MNKMNTTLLILAIFSITTLSGSALPIDKGANFSTNETMANSVNTDDTFVVNENVNVINITENSNETTVVESIIQQDQMKSSPGFALTDTMISLIMVLILIMKIVPPSGK
jgi:hypothetical protein